MSRQQVWHGMIRMDEEQYRALTRLAGDGVLREMRAYPVPIGECAGIESRAIYVVTNADGLACYAGQTMPSSMIGNASEARLKQHRSSVSKAAEWREYWVLPLLDGVSVGEVARLESAVCGRLGLPVVNRRWRRAEARIYGPTAG